MLRLYATMGKPVDALTEHIERLDREVDSFSELLGDIFEVFRSQQGRLPYELERVEATPLISRFVERFRRSLPPTTLLLRQRMRKGFGSGPMCAALSS